MKVRDSLSLNKLSAALMRQLYTPIHTHRNFLNFLLSQFCYLLSCSFYRFCCPRHLYPSAFLLPVSHKMSNSRITLSALSRNRTNSHYIIQPSSHNIVLVKSHCWKIILILLLPRHKIFVIIITFFPTWNFSTGSTDFFKVLFSTSHFQLN